MTRTTQRLALAQPPSPAMIYGGWQGAGFPKAIAIVLWRQNYALTLQQGASSFMNDPAIITLADLPANVASKHP